MYVKPEVRKGLLGRMLTELLDTRVMVKQAMKRTHGNKVRAQTMSEFIPSELNSFSLDPNQDARCTPTWIEVHRQCNIWVH
jgi:hypothetical protein